MHSLPTSAVTSMAPSKKLPAGAQLVEPVQFPPVAAVFGL